jgi:L-aspartate oxidase
MHYHTDFLVLGGGIAGLTFALKAAAHGSVTILLKGGVYDSNTAYAQGGVATVMASDDSFEEHIRDTESAGDGLCNHEVVETVVRSGPERIRELMSMGVNFTRGQGLGGEDLDLAREGGHSKRRILHVDDLTGRELQRVLGENARNHPNIVFRENTTAIELITTTRYSQRDLNRCVGAYILDESGEVETIRAKVTFLATGGAGKVYMYTSNPDGASGDGIALAYRAGARIANMEFFQFHPTCLFHPAAKNFLISEALRGEGGILRDSRGEAIMPRFHALADLGPRDAVARAIDTVMKASGEECVFLDITHKPADFLRGRFPHIHETCLRFGIDMTCEPIPIVPAAHYLCGGALVDYRGETTLRNLFAGGEVACSGLHGANRLASNSLLEGLVYGDLAATEAVARLADIPSLDLNIPDWNPGSAVDSTEGVVVGQNWAEIRQFMWNYVGIVRTDRRLARARRRIEVIQEEIRQYYWEVKVTRDLLELRNLAQVAELIIRSAQARKESRGLHYNLDYPHKDDRLLRNTVL